MKRFIFFLSLMAFASAAGAQTPAKTSGSSTSKSPGTHTASGTTASLLPAGVPRVAHSPMKTAFSLKYEDLKIGTGAVAEPNKIYKVFYTGYLGANGRPDDGHKFDSSDDHRRPVLKDGKPVMGPDGKPELGDPQPLEFPQGFGRLIPGFDQGFEGMRIGGKRRIFIPWQLAYGAHGRPGPDPEHPGIPPKADLIFDVELVDVADLPTPPARPAMGIHPPPGGVPPHPVTPPPATPAHPETTPPPASQAAPSTTPAQPAATPQSSAPATPPPSSSQPQPK